MRSGIKTWPEIQIPVIVVHRAPFTITNRFGRLVRFYEDLVTRAGYAHNSACT